MKKIKLSSKGVSLKKEEISNLTGSEMENIYGGSDSLGQPTTLYPCIETQPPYCDQTHGCTTIPYTTPPKGNS